MAADNEIAYSLTLDTSHAHRGAQQVIDDFTVMGTASVAAGQKGSSAVDNLAAAMNRFVSRTSGGMDDMRARFQDAIRNWQQQGDVIEENGKKVDAFGARVGGTQLIVRGLAQDLGIALPRAAARWISQLEGIAPLMSVAFAPIAIIGMIEALGAIPREWEKIKGAVTGWDENQKKIFEDQIALNQRYLRSLDDIAEAQIRLRGRVTGQLQQITVGQEINQKQSEFDRAQGDVNRLTGIQNIRQAVGSLGVSAVARQQGVSDNDIRGMLTGDSDKDLAAKLQKARDSAANLDLELKKLQGIDLPNAQFEDLSKTLNQADENARELYNIQKSYAELFGDKTRAGSALEAYRNNTFGDAGNGLSSFTKAQPAVQQVDAAVKSLLEDVKKLDEENQKLGDQFIEDQKFWDKQLEDYRDRTYGKDNGISADTVKAMDENSEFTAKAVTEGFKKIKTEEEKFEDSIRETAGRVWDDFFDRGKSVMDKLSSLIKGVLNTIGRTLFEDFATVLLTGGLGKKGNAGVATGVLGNAIGATHLGGLFGIQTAGSSSSPWSENIPGVGSSASGIARLRSGGGLLGAIFSGGGSLGATTASPSVSTIGSVPVLTGVGGALDTTIAPPAMGGIQGALGLGGGAGLFGLGAATVPVIGGILGSFAYGLWDFFHKHRNIAPTTPDALANNASPDLYFNSTPFAQITQTITKIGQQLNTTLTKVSTAVTGLTTAPPGQVMKDNFAAIKPDVTNHVVDSLGNNRGFRLSVAGAVLQQPL